MDYFGYHLAPTQAELTEKQYLFLLKGRPWFEEKIQKDSEKQSKRGTRRSNGGGSRMNMNPY